MKKLTTILVLFGFSFFIGTHGFDAPNKKALFASQIDFVLNMENAMASPESDAAGWAIGLWDFVNNSVYVWAKDMMTGFSDTMIGLGYPTCSDFPTSGTDTHPDFPTLVLTYAIGDKTIPSGTYWNDSATTYEKKLTAALGGTSFIEIQYNCDSAKPNVYLKYDFNTMGGMDRLVEMYAQHDSATDQVTIELKSVCADASEGCGTKQVTSMLMNTPDGDEYKIIGTRTMDDGAADEVKRLSVHGSKSTKLADIHRFDGTDLTSTADLDSLTAGVTNDCVDFDEATYIPAGGAADCATATLSADTELPTASSNALGMGDLQGATVNGLTINFL